MKKLLSLTVCLLFVLSQIMAQLSVPSFFSDHMVLQREKPINIWGTASAGERISVTLGNAQKSTRTDKNGKWSVSLPPMQAGGPYTLNVKSLKQTLSFTDILIGEVWICSGQSNMEFRLRSANHATEEVAAANYPQIRSFNVIQEMGHTPKADLKGKWEVCSPASASDFSAVGYFFVRELYQKLNIPIGFINSSWGGTDIEPWISGEYLRKLPAFAEKVDSVASLPLTEKVSPHAGTALYNAMIHPIKQFTIKGTIWYQGESNLNNPQVYKRLFPAMVRSWRKEWNQGEFPFYYVQIAPYDYGRKNADKTEAAEIRQVQLECLKEIPNAGMVVTADIGNRTCVHPSDKESVGKRLALWALAKTYQRSGTPYSGPLYKSFTIDKEKIIVEFDYAEMGMTSYDREIVGFEIAGKDGIYYPAKAVLFDNKTKVMLTSDQVPEPVGVKYGFRNYQPLNLFSNFGLPASPFVAK